MSSVQANQTNQTNSTNLQSSKYTKNTVRRVGKTLIVKPTVDNFDDTPLQKLNGLASLVKSEKSGSYFLIFENITQSTKALETLLEKHSDELRAKPAHYKVFFTMQGLTDESDYNEVKKTHTEWVKGKTGGEVLYYKLYRKDDKYLGCGDMTLDTKDSSDQLLNRDEDGFKNYSLGDDLEGVFHRFHKRSRD